MRCVISIKDVSGATELECDPHISPEEESMPPTGAAILMSGLLALYRSGILEQAGVLALEALSTGQDPAQVLKDKYARTFETRDHHPEGKRTDP